MFPARAGMSRNTTMSKINYHSVPRASGDEPGLIPEGESGGGCSPRERG